MNKTKILITLILLIGCQLTFADTGYVYQCAPPGLSFKQVSYGGQNVYMGTNAIVRNVTVECPINGSGSEVCGTYGTFTSAPSTFTGAVIVDNNTIACGYVPGKSPTEEPNVELFAPITSRCHFQTSSGTTCSGTNVADCLVDCSTQK